MAKASQDAEDALADLQLDLAQVVPAYSPEEWTEHLQSTTNAVHEALDWLGNKGKGEAKFTHGSGPFCVGATLTTGRHFADRRSVSRYRRRHARRGMTSWCRASRPWG